jgi:hypothetical protein
LICYQWSVYWKIPLPPEGEISADVIWGENMRWGREKGGKCKRKGRTGESKRENWK